MEEKECKDVAARAFLQKLGQQLTAFFRKQEPAESGPARVAPAKTWVQRSVRARKKGFEKALKEHDTPVNIHGVILPYDADTGADETVMTQATLDWIRKHATTPIEITKVRPYSTMLADGSRVMSDTLAYADFELITHVGSTILKRVKCNILPVQHAIA